jgi:siroheme synthase
MSAAQTQSRIPLSHRGKRPRFFDAAGTDELLSMVLELTAEVWVVKKRLYLLERVADQAGVPLTPRIEGYELDEQEVAELAALRQQLIATVLRSLEGDPAERGRVRREMEELGAGPDAPVAAGTAHRAA